MERKFYYCINYQFTGFPKPTKLWYFNGKPLNLSSSIKDLETNTIAANDDLFLTTGKHSLDAFSRAWLSSFFH